MPRLPHQRSLVLAIPDRIATNQKPKTYPHTPIPAARLFFVFLCVYVFSATSGNPEVGGLDNFLGSLPNAQICARRLPGGLCGLRSSTRWASSPATCRSRVRTRQRAVPSKMAGQPVSRKEPVRFGSVRLRTFLKLIGSVRFGSENYNSWLDVVRPAFFGRVVARSGSVRFGSVPRPVPAGSGIKRFGSVRPARFGSVSYSFLSKPANALEAGQLFVWRMHVWVGALDL